MNVFHVQHFIKLMWEFETFQFPIVQYLTTISQRNTSVSSSFIKMKPFLVKLKTKIFPENHSDETCLVCTLSLAQVFGNYIGLCPMDQFCKHTTKKIIDKPYVSSTLKIFTGIISSITFVTIFSVYFYLLINEDKIPKLQMFAEMIFCFQTSSLLLGYLIKIKTHILVVNGWVNLIQNSKIFGIKTLLNNTDSKWLKKQSIFMSLIIIIATVTFGIVQYLIKIEENLLITIFRRVSCLLGIYVQLVAIFRIVIYQYFLGKLLERFKTIICSHLTLRIPTFENINVLKIDYEELVSSENLTKQLKLFSRFYSAVLLNVKHFNDLINLVSLIWFLCDLGVLIINIYLIVKGFQVGLIGNELVLLEISTTFVTIGLLCVVQSVNSVLYVSDEICSVLYRLPIRKLRRDEAEEVENLINNLTLQKPVLNACDMFLITTQLLASISGTVVTYVLVALQFRPSWELENPSELN